jgi:hypothetical protein
MALLYVWRLTQSLLWYIQQLHYCIDGWNHHRKHDGLYDSTAVSPLLSLDYCLNAVEITNRLFKFQVAESVQGYDASIPPPERSENGT